MDIKEGWEKKALIGIGIVFFIIIVYAYFVPFSGTPEPTPVQNQVAPVNVVTVPYTNPSQNNSTANNSSANSTLLSAAQAQNIALNAYPGYTAGTPTQENDTINGTNYNVWKVPISKPSSPSLTIFIDAASGRIVKVA